MNHPLVSTLKIPTASPVTQVMTHQWRTSSHNAADKCSMDVSYSNPPSPGGTPKCRYNYHRLAYIDSSERRVDFAEDTNLAPPTHSFFKAAKPASRQLETYLPDLYNDNRSRSRTRSQTGALSETSLEGDNSEQKSAQIYVGAQLLDSNSRRFALLPTRLRRHPKIAL